MEWIENEQENEVALPNSRRARTHTLAQTQFSDILRLIKKSRMEKKL